MCNQYLNQLNKLVQNYKLMIAVNVYLVATTYETCAQRSILKPPNSKHLFFSLQLLFTLQFHLAFMKKMCEFSQSAVRIQIWSQKKPTGSFKIKTVDASHSSINRTLKRSIRVYQLGITSIKLSMSLISYKISPSLRRCN